MNVMDRTEREVENIEMQLSNLRQQRDVSRAAARNRAYCEPGRDAAPRSSKASSARKR